MPIERPQVDRAVLPAGRARVGQPRDASSNSGADRRIEPQRSPASLARVPDRHDLLRIGERLALGLGAPGLSRSTCSGALSFLRSAVGTHGRERYLDFRHVPKALSQPCSLSVAYAYQDPKSPLPTAAGRGLAAQAATGPEAVHCQSFDLARNAHGDDGGDVGPSPSRAALFLPWLVLRRCLSFVDPRNRVRLVFARSEMPDGATPRTFPAAGSSVPIPVTRSTARSCE